MLFVEWHNEISSNVVIRLIRMSTVVCWALESLLRCLISDKIYDQVETPSSLNGLTKYCWNKKKIKYFND